MMGWVKKAIALSVLVFATSLSVLAQATNQPVNRANALQPATTTPTGACYRNQVRINVSTVYVCPQSGTATWTAVSGGGGGGIGTSDSPTLTGAWTWSLSNAAAVAIGPNGNTNPTFRVVTNVASAATGLSITGNAAGSGVTLSALSSGTNENLAINAKGTGRINIAGGNWFFTSTGSAGVNDGTGISGATGGLVFAEGGTGHTRVHNGAFGAIGSGAGRFGIFTSSDTSAAQLDVRSQTVGVPAAQFQAASGESASATVLSVKDGAGAETFKVANNGLMTTPFGLVSNGANQVSISYYQPGIVLGSSGTLSITNGAASGTVDAVIRRAAAANLAQGAADVNGTPVSQRSSVQNAITGSNLPGSTRHFDGSQGTGSGNGGDIDFNVALPGAGATTQNTLVNAVKISGSTGAAVFSLGSQSAPSITFTGNTNTGLYRSNTNQVGITAGSSPAALFDGSTLTLGQWAAASSHLVKSASAGGGNTNRAGYGLTLSPGESTGNGASGVVTVQGGAPPLASGTTLNSFVTRERIGNVLVVANNTTTTAATWTLASNTVLGGKITYTVEVSNGTDLQVETGEVALMGINKAGTFSDNTALKYGNQQAATAGTLSVTWSMTAANPSLLRVNVNSSLTPTTGFPRVTYSIVNNGQQAVQ
jgi:hypothetical protein